MPARGSFSRFVPPLATLLHSTRSRGQLRAPSTASHIDSFLDAITLHAEAEQAWHPRFQSKKEANKWEELGAVASIAACLILVLLGKQERLLERRAQVRELTSEKKGPDSTQNKTQWKHIADSLLSILEVLDISADEAKAVLEERFGTSAIDGLIELRALQIDA